MIRRATALLTVLQFSTIVLGGVALASAHAAAKNHDVQDIRIPPAPSAHHDRASGPVSGTVPLDGAPSAD